MATKNKKSAPSKKESAKESVSHAKSEKKGGKAAVKAAAQPEVAEGAPVVSADELEELEEAAAESASNGGGNAAALAAASGATEMSASFKNFRHHPDMENFYRFIYENDLRHEALAIIDQIMVEKQNRRMLKTAKAQAH